MDIIYKRLSSGASLINEIRSKKKMKKKVYIYIVLVFMGFGAVAQAPRTIFYSGIFKTAQDFRDGNLSFRVNCDSSSGKIRLHNFFSGKYVSIIQNGKENKLSKDSIFGYRDCKGIDYRFYGNYDYEYQIMENKSVVIYAAILQDPAYTGKGIKMVATYFFSKTLNSNILPLTVVNLKQVFPGDMRFCSMSDKDLVVFDDTHKMYKINYLLTQPNNILQ